jgi:predicted TPR repeat methyltransferase
MFIEIMGAKYPPDMREIMNSVIPGEKKVLDLGCGNGAW